MRIAILRIPEYRLFGISECRYSGYYLPWSLR
jgi:hypothetical protein